MRFLCVCLRPVKRCEPQKVPSEQKIIVRTTLSGPRTESGHQSLQARAVFIVIAGIRPALHKLEFAIGHEGICAGEKRSDGNHDIVGLITIRRQVTHPVFLTNTHDAASLFDLFDQKSI
jgi:hypothetical protein